MLVIVLGATMNISLLFSIEEGESAGGLLGEVSCWLKKKEKKTEENEEKWEPSYNGNVKRCSWFEKHLAVPQKVKQSYHMTQKYPSENICPHKA